MHEAKMATGKKSSVSRKFLIGVSMGLIQGVAKAELEIEHRKTLGAMAKFGILKTSEF